MAKVEKRGRYYYILKDGIVAGKRRSEELAHKFLRSLYFRPISKVKVSLSGTIGRSCGFSWYDGTVTNG